MQCPSRTCSSCEHCPIRPAVAIPAPTGLLASVFNTLSADTDARSSVVQTLHECTIEVGRILDDLARGRLTHLTFTEVLVSLKTHFGSAANAVFPHFRSDPTKVVLHRLVDWTIAPRALKKQLIRSFPSPTTLLRVKRNPPQALLLPSEFVSERGHDQNTSAGAFQNPMLIPAAEDKQLRRPFGFFDVARPDATVRAWFTLSLPAEYRRLRHADDTLEVAQAKSIIAQSLEDVHAVYAIPLVSLSSARTIGVVVGCSEGGFVDPIGLNGKNLNNRLLALSLLGRTIAHVLAAQARTPSATVFA